MNFQGAIGFMIAGFYMLGASILLGYGANNGDWGMITAGSNMMAIAFGAVMRQFFPDIVKAIKGDK